MSYVEGDLYLSPHDGVVYEFVGTSKQTRMHVFMAADGNGLTVVDIDDKVKFTRVPHVIELDAWIDPNTRLLSWDKGNGFVKCKITYEL